MFRTLAFLATAMITTSTLLAWMNPAPPASFRILAWNDALAMAQSAVDFDDIDAMARQWGGVTLLTDDVGVAPRLAATADRADFHFHIDLDGRPTCTRQWRNQVVWPADAYAVRIRIARRTSGEPMSRAQWQSVRALLSVLRPETVDDAVPWLVRLDSAWAAVYDVDSDTPPPDQDALIRFVQ